jgi:hypothetical protein
MDLDRHYDLLANGISLTREQARRIVESYLQREACGPGCDCLGNGKGASNSAQYPASGLRSPDLSVLPVMFNNDEANRNRATAGDRQSIAELARSFFAGALMENLAASNMFRITTTSFMDVYNFDLRQLMKSCVHHVLPGGHLIPFDAWNVLYRNGHIPLPSLSPKLETIALK